MTIHRGLVLAAPVAEIVVELLQRLFVVAPVTLEGDGEIFIGMGVVERERAGFVERGRIVDRSGSGEQQQRRQAETISGLRQRQRFELAFETSQHYEPTQDDRSRNSSATPCGERRLTQS